MAGKKSDGSADWSDLDDTPELTSEMRDTALVYDGDRFLRRGCGRPKGDSVTKQISVRLDPGVIAKLRDTGLEWQSRINSLLRVTLGLAEPGKHAA